MYIHTQVIKICMGLILANFRMVKSGKGGKTKIGGALPFFETHFNYKNVSVNWTKCLHLPNHGVLYISIWVLFLYLSLHLKCFKSILWTNRLFCGMSLNMDWSRDFPGGAVVKNQPANAGDTGSSPGRGRSHMPRSNEARAPQLLSPCAANIEARTPRAPALQREATSMKSPRTPTKSSPHSPQLEKAWVKQRRPEAAKNKF